MTLQSRRTVLKRAGIAGAALALGRPALIGVEQGVERGGGALALARTGLLSGTRRGLIGGSTLLGVERGALAGTALASAVTFLRGTAQKLGTVILSDVTSLNMMPLTATRFFFSTAYRLHNTMPVGYPGKFSLIGTYNAQGLPGFAVNILPPTPELPSEGPATNLGVQVFMSNSPVFDTGLVSMTFPNLIGPDGAWHTLFVGVGIIPGTPNRWNIGAIDINQAPENFAVKIGVGYLTGVQGERLEPSQALPPSFNVPMINTGLAGGDKFVLALGQPVRSKLGGYAPAYSAGTNYLDSTPADFTQTIFHANLPENPNLGSIFPQLMNSNGAGTNGNPTNIVMSAVAKAAISTGAAEESVNQLSTSGIPSQTTMTAAFQNINASTSDITSALTAATRNNASPDVLTNLIQSNTNIRSAVSSISSGNVLGAINGTVNAMSYVSAAAEAQGQSPVNSSAATSTNITNINNVTIVSGAPAPQLYLSGNASSTIDPATGATIASSSSPGPSAYTDQTTGFTMQTPGGIGYAPAQQAPDDPYMQVISIDTVPNVP